MQARKVKEYPSLVAARAAKARYRQQLLKPVIPVDIPIEHGIPMPSANRGGWPTTVWPFGRMEVGDSFFVPTTNTVAKYKRSRFSTITHAAMVFRKDGHMEWRFTCRTLPDGVRCWRVA